MDDDGARRARGSSAPETNRGCLAHLRSPSPRRRSLPSRSESDTNRVLALTCSLEQRFLHVVRTRAPGPNCLILLAPRSSGQVNPGGPESSIPLPPFGEIVSRSRREQRLGLADVASSADGTVEGERALQLLVRLCTA